MGDTAGAPRRSGRWFFLFLVSQLLSRGYEFPQIIPDLKPPFSMHVRTATDIVKTLLFYPFGMARFFPAFYDAALRQSSGVAYHII
jgi:hypothetical protein